jgi:hypothetical protein
VFSTNNANAGNPLQDFALVSEYEVPIEVYVAKEIVTLDPKKTKCNCCRSSREENYRHRLQE